MPPNPVTWCCWRRHAPALISLKTTNIAGVSLRNLSSLLLRSQREKGPSGKKSWRGQMDVRLDSIAGWAGRADGFQRVGSNGRREVRLTLPLSFSATWLGPGGAGSHVRGHDA